MTRKEVEHVLDTLQRIKEPDGRVLRAIASCEKQLKIFDSMRGQLKDQYEVDNKSWW